MTDTVDIDFVALVEGFQQEVVGQRPAAPEHYDTEYFADDWREGDNRYELETRRRIEDRNPQLIRDLLVDGRVLDMGCGPGFLMLFLQELGVDVDGIDFSGDVVALAPPEVRDRIRVGPVTEALVEAQAYDLVICREVIEHLTVVQVQKTVEQICRASKHLVYVTTRFHPAPASLLDFTTQFDVDPTHITLLNKEFLRVLFVLQGFRRRADLEQQMDWGNKDRVLVYERVPQAV